MDRPASFQVEPRHRASLRTLGLDSLESCLAFTGGMEVKAAVPGRDVRRVQGDGGTYFVKRVRGPGWRDVLRECRMLHQLHRSGLPVPQPVAAGAAYRAAVLLTLGLPAETTLEQLILHQNPGAERLELLVRRSAELLRGLHEQGVNHRDYYVGHLLVDAEDRLYVVDLGRAERRHRVPRRRVVKDLAAFNFSLPPAVGYPELRQIFVREYLGSGTPAGRLERLATAVERKSRRIEDHVRRKIARGDPNVHLNR